MFRGFLILALVVSTAAISFSSTASARGRWGRVDLNRSNGPTLLGPWVPGPWDGEWAEKQRGGSTAWGEPLHPVFDEWYPWGYTAPFTRVGRLCVANDVNRSPGGDIVRYQRVRPSYYCRGY